MQVKTLFAGLLALIMIQGGAFAQLTSYSQDFETFATADSDADTGAPNDIAADGYVGFATNYAGAVGDTSTFAFNYGTFPAPNGGPGFSGIADNVSQAGLPTGPQGTRHLNIYSDYNEGSAHGGTTNWLDALVFKDNNVAASDVGSVWDFTFDYKANSQINMDTMAPFGPSGDTNTFAFVKVLQSSNNSFDTIAEFEVETTSASLTDWTTDTISVNIDAAYAGELLQFGFRSEAQNGSPSGMLYDNVSFTNAVPEPGSAVLGALVGLGFMTRRRR